MAMNMRSKTRFASLASLCVAACLTSSAGRAITIEMTTVGDPGNAADTTGYGAVLHEYQIGKYEITIGQYTAFLNAVAAADPNAVYNSNMASDSNVAGIVRTGISGAFVYTVTGPSGVAPSGADSPGDRPVTYVSWFDAARFANWVANGQPAGAQGPTTTENGAYDLVNAPPGAAPAANVTNPNTGAEPLYRIPTQNEWYKAAFYKGGSASAGYWTYATQSDTTPGNNLGGGPNQVNYMPSGAFAVTQSSGYSSSQNYLTNAGAFSSSPSAYGTFDQSGNVGEWNDIPEFAPSSSAGLRGGAWGDGAIAVSSAPPSHEIDASLEHDAIGFRLAAPAAVPEPSTSAMALAGLAGGFSLWRRRRA